MILVVPIVIPRCDEAVIPGDVPEHSYDFTAIIDAGEGGRANARHVYLGESAASIEEPMNVQALAEISDNLAAVVNAGCNRIGGTGVVVLRSSS